MLLTTSQTSLSLFPTLLGECMFFIHFLPLTNLLSIVLGCWLQNFLDPFQSWFWMLYLFYLRFRAHLEPFHNLDLSNLWCILLLPRFSLPFFFRFALYFPTVFSIFTASPLFSYSQFILLNIHLPSVWASFFPYSPVWHFTWCPLMSSCTASAALTFALIAVVICLNPAPWWKKSSPHHCPWSHPF